MIGLTKAEEQIMQFLWKLGEGTVQSVLAWPFLVMILMLCACDSSREGQMIGESRNTINLVHSFSRADVIPLKMNGEELVCSIDKLVQADSLYFVYDRKQKSMFRFDGTGTHLNTLQKYGEGPQEYLGISDFDVDKDNHKLYLLCSPERIMVFDWELNLDSIIELDGDYQRIAVDDGRVYLYRGARTLHQLNADGSTRLVHTSSPMAKYYMGFEPVFHHVGDTLLYIPHGDCSVYRIDEAGLQEFLPLDYPMKSQVEEKMNSAEELSIEDMARYTPPSVSLVYLTDGLCHIHYSYQLVVRECVVDVMKGSVVQDGMLSFGGKIPQSVGDGCLLSWDYCTEKGISTPSDLNVGGSFSDLDEEDITIVKYALNGD